MSGEGTHKKEDKTKSDKSGTAPDASGLFEMMKKCCIGEEKFSNCSAVLKSRMGAMTSMPCCGPGREKTGPDRREK